MKRDMRSCFLILLSLALTLPLTAGEHQRVPVPNDTLFVIRLLETISSKHSQVGDGFTATVVSPRAYRGAVITGRISHLDTSSRLEEKSELGITFDGIQLRDGRRARFVTELIEVRQSEAVKVVDEAGNIHSGRRGRQAIKRTAARGSVVGGRQGAAVGLLISAGAAAGTLLIDGGKELTLEPGAEMVIRTIRSDAASNVLRP